MFQLNLIVLRFTVQTVIDNIRTAEVSQVQRLTLWAKLGIAIVWGLLAACVAEVAYRFWLLRAWWGGRS